MSKKRKILEIVSDTTINHLTSMAKDITKEVLNYSDEIIDEISENTRSRIKRKIRREDTNEKGDLSEKKAKRVKYHRRDEDDEE